MEVVMFVVAGLFLADDVVAASYGGIEFPLGELSFADRLESFSLGPNTAFPYDDATTTIGIPDYVPLPTGQPDGTLALGNSGSILLEFVDNRLVDQDLVENGLDLFIFEAGAAIEPFGVEISKDGVNFLSLGILVGQPTGIDIKPFVNPGDAFRFVRIVDANSQLSGSPFAGADIDAVGAIGAITPEPGSCVLGISIALVQVWMGARSRRGAV